MNYISTNGIFANKLKQLREKAGLSQTQLANELNISRGSISYYENNERLPDIDVLVRICKYFNVSADYLVGLSDIPSLDEDLQAVCKYTGMSESAIYQIKNVLENKNFYTLRGIINEQEWQKHLDITNQIISNPHFWYIVRMLERLSIFSQNILDDDRYYKVLSSYDDKILNFLKSEGISELSYQTHIQADDDKISRLAIDIHNEERECKLLRYETFSILENLINEYDHRYDYKKYERNKLFDFLHLSEKDLIKIRKIQVSKEELFISNQKGSDNAQHQAEEE